MNKMGLREHEFDISIISSPLAGEDQGRGELISIHPHPKLPPSRGKGLEGYKIFV
jgi:hypothetical protein